ncbi:hypothetical protein NLU13_8894 [Sarocladium strictum]|uniref:Protein root UVB sensitive/RUS domain-containing protein n=1 Tax=Sarocladium strictum TaxID=5046 RepID=A0AA39GA95_SARSR|nr:hypothetical protein NLU13_8894 [Sarocladium strictum]
MSQGPESSGGGPNGNVEIRELDRSGNVQRRWLQSPAGGLSPILAEGQSASTIYTSLREWRKTFFDAFLPVGYPHSVSNDYISYQVYDSLQAFFSTIVSLLANRALLEGLGVGDADSSATFAMLLTIMKDAMSRIATIIFAQQFGLRIEPEAKCFRFLADLFNDTAFFLELYSPMLGPWGKFTALGIGEALRALCGVAAGASKAALSVHFAKHDNLAELNAKEASQETAVGLVGLLVGTLVVRYVQDRFTVLHLMTVLVLMHLWMNFRGVCSVCMDTLNRQRATKLFEEYLRSGKVLSPHQVAARENILHWKCRAKDDNGKALAIIKMAKSWPHAMRVGERAFPTLSYEISGSTKLQVYRGAAVGGLDDIRIILGPDATVMDILRAWYEAISTARRLKDGTEAQMNDDAWAETAAEGFEKLWLRMEVAGWNLKTQALETGPPVRIEVIPVEKKKQ